MLLDNKLYSSSAIMYFEMKVFTRMNSDLRNISKQQEKDKWGSQ
jgi:hypothetical protein